MGCLLHSKADTDTATDRSGYNDSYYFRIDHALSTMTTYINTTRTVYHIELDLYIQGNLLFSDERSLKTTDGNTKQNVAGDARGNGYREGVGEAAWFYYITGFTQTSRRNVIVVDSINHCLRIVDRLTLQTERFAGVCETFVSTDRLQGRFSKPYSVIADNQNEDNLLVTDSYNKAVRLVDLITRKVSTFLRDTRVNYLHGITQDTQSGDLYLTSFSAVYHLTYRDKILTLLAGHPTLQGYADGTFSDSRFDRPGDLLLMDNNKKILVSDTYNHRLRVLDRVSNTTESICTGFPGHANGDVGRCSLSFPASLLVSGDSVYIGQRWYIRKLSGVILSKPTTTLTTTPTTTQITTSLTATTTDNFGDTTTTMAASIIPTAIVIILIISLVAVVCRKRNLRGRMRNTIELNLHRELPVPDVDDMPVSDYESLGDEYDLISVSNMLPDAESSDNDSLGTEDGQMSQNGMVLDDDVSFISRSELDVGMYFVESDASSSQGSENNCPLVREDYAGVYATGSIHSVELHTVDT